MQRVRFFTPEPFRLQIGFFDVNQQFSLLFGDETSGVKAFVPLAGEETR